MPMSKAAKRIEQERKRRHAAIRRGMRIALYEVNQALVDTGVKIETPPGWIDYTVALAEGGRRKAPLADVIERAEWSIAMTLRERAADRSRQFAALVERARERIAQERERVQAGAADRARTFQALIDGAPEREAARARAREAVLRLFR